MATQTKIQTVATRGGIGDDRVESVSNQIRLWPPIQAKLTLRIRREM